MRRSELVMVLVGLVVVLAGCGGGVVVPVYADAQAALEGGAQDTGAPPQDGGVDAPEDAGTACGTLEPLTPCSPCCAAGGGMCFPFDAGELCTVLCLDPACTTGRCQNVPGIPPVCAP